MMPELSSGIEERCKSVLDEPISILINDRDTGLILLQDDVGLVQALQRFAVQELSNFYLDVAKDRLYISGPSSYERRCLP